MGPAYIKPRNVSADLWGQTWKNAVVTHAKTLVAGVSDVDKRNAPPASGYSAVATRTLKFGMEAVVWLSYKDIERGYISLPVNGVGGVYDYTVRPGNVICIRWQEWNYLDDWNIHPSTSTEIPAYYILGIHNLTENLLWVPILMIH